MTVKIGNTDITQYVQEKSYKIDSDPKYSTWEDGNHIKHRRLLSAGVPKGSMELVFLTSSDYSAFLSLIEANTSDGKVTMTFPVRNINTSVTAAVYIKISTVRHENINETYDYMRFKMEVNNI